MASLSDLSLLTTKAYLNGEWVTKPHSFAVSNPLSSEVVAEVSDYLDKGTLLPWRTIPSMA